MSRRYGSWAETSPISLSFCASWATFAEKISSAPSKRPTLVEVEPGLMTRMR